MARIDFDAIKAAVTMEAVLEDYSIMPRRGWAICPLHADRHPSLKVYKDGYYCFACGSGGDVITFVARMENVSNAQAAALIMARHGLGYAVADGAARRRREEQRSKQQAMQKRLLECSDILCAARRADGGIANEWDYWLDLMEDSPEEFFRQGGEEAVKRAQRVYGGGIAQPADLRSDAED